MQLEAQLADRHITIELSQDAKDWLVERGYDEQMGARPMSRVIQEYIKKPLAEHVLFGKLKDGGHVRVTVVKDDEGFMILGFDFPKGPVAPKPEPVAPDVRRIAKRAAARADKPAAKKGKGKPGGSVPKVPLQTD